MRIFLALFLAVVAVGAWVYGPVLGDYAKPLFAFGVICWAALWILRAYDSGRWTWGSILLPDEPGSSRRLLVLLSFACLFFELLVIRWLSVEVRVFAYFKNLALIACFLGFGLGVYASRRRIPLLYVPAVVALLALMLRLPWPAKDGLLRRLPQIIAGFDDLAVWGTHAEQAFLGGERGVLFVTGVIVITMFFSMSALMFVPLGQAVGYALDHDANPILAYSLNVAASLAGVWAFTLVSALSLPPAWWFAIGLVPLLPLWRRDKSALAAAVAMSLLVAGLVWERDPRFTVLWSPYQKLKLNVSRVLEGRPVQWNLQVNNTGYQQMSEHSAEFLGRNPDLMRGEPWRMLGYNVPFAFRPDARRILIVGSGLGNDVAGALRNTQAGVVAVEIDPAIYGLGRDLHPERPYQSPRVQVVINDARNFFETTSERFDLVLFGLLDAHTLGSAYTNVRLDNYVYTRESLARAAGLLAPGGVMVLKFEVDREFIGQRLEATLREIFGSAPICFRVPNAWSTGATIFVAGRDGAAAAALAADPQLAAGVAERTRTFVSGAITPTTDDWPYLYQRERTIPRVYLLLSAVLLAVTLFLLWNQGMPARFDPHFLFLGMAFLLLEVQVISKLALFFGATWQVNTLVITAVLLMILLANMVAARWPVSPRVAYPLLLASLLLTYLLPAESLFLGGSRWITGVVLAAIFTLPVFFAGLIFIHSFARAASRSIALGSNLVGAMAGGLLESASFVLGVKALLLVAMAAYVLSWIRLPARRAVE